MLEEFIYTANDTFTWPAGAEFALVEAWGGGGGHTSSIRATAGGGGGGYSRAIVTKTDATAAIVVGSGGTTGAGGDSTFTQGITINLRAKGGSGGLSDTGGAGGQESAGIGDVKFSGGSGANSENNSNEGGSGGGAAASKLGAGASGQVNTGATGGAGGVGVGGGGSGGAGGDNTQPGNNGEIPGGGGGGEGAGANGGSGARGEVRVYTGFGINPTKFSSGCCCGECEDCETNQRPKSWLLNVTGFTGSYVDYNREYVLEKDNANAARCSCAFTARRQVGCWAYVFTPEDDNSADFDAVFLATADFNLDTDPLELARLQIPNPLVIFYKLNNPSAGGSTCVALGLNSTADDEWAAVDLPAPCVSILNGEDFDVPTFSTISEDDNAVAVVTPLN